jgi:hypothetical protein
MNKYLIGVALLLPHMAYADTSAQDRSNYCIVLSNIYPMAATYRDHNMPPEKALENAQASEKYVPLPTIKKAINQVYFDKDFTYAGGDALRNQVLDVCLHGPKNYRPLK